MFKQLTIARFRGFERLSIAPLDRFNLILGRNNVGKTAVLEALFLLVGPTNPELALRISIFRGIEQFNFSPEELWGWLFNKKDMTQTIQIEGQTETGRHRSLRLSIQEARSARIKPARRNGTKRAVRMADAQTTTNKSATPPDLLLEYRGDDGETTKTRAFLKEGGLGYQRQKIIHLPTSIFVTSRAGYSSENPQRYSKLEETGAEGALLPPLQLLEPRLKRLAVLITGGGPLLHADLGLGRMVPIPLMGEGVGKLLTILLSIANAPGGVVMLDEIETGLHYSVMADVWTAVAEAARTYDVQVVATTHSWECLRAAHTSFAAGPKYDLTVHRLDRSAGAIETVAYDRDQIGLALDSGMELR